MDIKEATDMTGLFLMIAITFGLMGGITVALVIAGIYTWVRDTWDKWTNRHAIQLEKKIESEIWNLGWEMGRENPAPEYPWLYTAERVRLRAAHYNRIKWEARQIVLARYEGMLEKVEEEIGPEGGLWEEVEAELQHHATANRMVSEWGNEVEKDMELVQQMVGGRK